MRLKNYTLETTVFTCGALVMIYEIIGSRLLAPYIGTSTYVWTSLIGVILAALSLGYWLGGRWADRRPDVKILASVIFLAGGMVSLTILFGELILALISQIRIGLEIKSMLAALLLFAPASVLLGCVTPFAVKLKMTSLADSGKTVGRLYALSTVGSIFGTFLAGFVLIPFLGSTKTLYLIGASLIGLSVLLAPFVLKQSSVAVIVLFFFGVGASELKSIYLSQTYDAHDIDTEYSRLQVMTGIDPKTNKRMRLLAFDPYFIQSGMYLDSDELAFEYSKYYHLLRHFKPDFQNTLLIGGAGYSFPKDYLKKYPEARIDVVEIDPQMTAIARQYFRLEENPRLEIFHEDGRVFLNRAEPNRYDAVLMDAFGTLFTVPFQLTTVEAVGRINRVLKDDGIVIFNIGGALEGASNGFLQAELKTYRQIFPRVYLFKIYPETPDEKQQNFIIIACKEKNTVLPENPNTEFSALLSHLYPNPPEYNFPVLTDDLAPVEYYNSFALSRLQK
ncbi:MAG TPA: fused MFS/spermidine synthase [Pyrinomonadaceae bacterium]